MQPSAVPRECNDQCVDDINIEFRYFSIASFVTQSFTAKRMRTNWRILACGLVATTAFGCAKTRPFTRWNAPAADTSAAAGESPTAVQTAYVAPGKVAANKTETSPSDAPTAEFTVIRNAPSTQPANFAAAVESMPAPVGDDKVRLDMSTALMLVAGQNPQVGYARWRIREAYANLEQANVLWLPSIQAGMNYHHHEGTLQDSNGNILEVSRSSLEAGLGAGAVGAGTTPQPGIVAQFQLVDAIFQPAIAQRNAWAQEHARDAVLNDQLLEAAVAYQELLRAHQLRAVARQTESGSNDLVQVTSEYARAGQGTQADADRSRAEFAVRQNNVARSEEAVAVASARLAQVLSMPTASEIVPVEDSLAPIQLVEASGSPRDELELALTNRPELKEAQNLVAAAVERLRRERYAPFVPSVFLGASYDGFGGGIGDTVGDFNDRADFDAMALWQIRNLGYGEQAARQAANARVQQETMRQVRVMDTIAREVVEAKARVRHRFGRIAIARSGVESAQESFSRNFARIREGQGLPIEVLQAIQSLDTSQRELVDVTADYNVAQFQLQRALGWPVRKPGEAVEPATK